MSRIGRLVGALAFPVSLWTPEAEAQTRRPVSTAEPPATEAMRDVPFEFRQSRRDSRAIPVSEPIGLTGTIPLGPNFHFAVGRLSVPSFRAPRVEADEIRRGYRNIAAIGFSLRF